MTWGGLRGGRFGFGNGTFHSRRKQMFVNGTDVKRYYPDYDLCRCGILNFGARRNH